MFGDTISLGGKTYSKINQDQYGSVYRYLDVAYEARITVRHSSRIDASRNRIRIDRHNIEWSIRSFGVSGAPDQLQKVYWLENTTTTFLLQTRPPVPTP